MDLDNNICKGCLSEQRRLVPIIGTEAEFFNRIVEAAGGCTYKAVCWECKARAQGIVNFSNTVGEAARILPLLLKDSSPHTLVSLSRLSIKTNNFTIYITHDDGEEKSPMFVKMENDDLDSFINEDDNVEFEMKSSIEQRTRRLSSLSLSKDEFSKRRKKTKKHRRENGDDFDESDDEPLATKTRQKTKQPRKEKGKRKKRGEQAAGVVVNSRVTARLDRLGLPPGSLEMVVLSWEEVEAERQRQLSSESYLRHKHRCARCAVGFNHRLKLEQHMKKHCPSAGAHECGACGVRSRAAHALAAHRRRHRVRWRCAWCGALWSRAAVAADHLRRAHAAPPAPAHPCPRPRCTHRAQSLSKLRAHMKTHASSQPCPECGKAFLDRASLRTHLFSHRADKEHACGECGARFLYPRALHLHRATHAPAAPLYCAQCDVAFKNPMSYYQHMRYNLRHVHPDKLKHACAYCGARFVRAARLAEHVAARHTRALPHLCTHAHCSYKSASRAVLRAHVRSAHGAGGARVRRLICHACGKAYTTKKSLDSHLRSHASPRAPSVQTNQHTDITESDTRRDAAANKSGADATISL